MNLTQTEVRDFDDWGNLFKYQSTWAFEKFLWLPYKTIAAFTGNQWGKTAAFAYSYVLRIKGWHPIPEKNILYFECPQEHKFNVLQLPESSLCPHCGGDIKIHYRGSRIFRFCSETLPQEKETTSRDGVSAEVKNTTYPAFKKWLPPSWIKKDITYRTLAMIISDPNDGKVFCGKEYRGDDILVEFVSYAQTIQSGAGVQRVSCWCDEEPPFDFYEEQLPRLMAEEGDFLLSLTPAQKISWTQEVIFERAKRYIRTKAICDFLETKDYKPKQIEETESPDDIAVIQAATDDNPTLKKSAIDQMVSGYGDPDLEATRRFGISKMLKGRIFNDFDYPVHFIDGDKYFPDGVPYNWRHARACDYHAQTPWAIGCIALSPENEAFIYLEYNPSPQRETTREICRNCVMMCGDYKYSINLIDPQSETIRKDNVSVLDDINREFYNLKKEDIGTGGFWVTWDSKGERGRDAIKERLKNAKAVGRPFNNRVEGGRYLPTLWILNNCKISAQHLKMWRWTEVPDMRTKLIKGQTTDKTEQRFSHFCTTYEAIFKHPAFKSRPSGPPRTERKVGYFQGR